ncbi:MAG: dihydrolipoamide acetyltransferase family protein [Deltaproteobacteria bacterium]|nr:dihydrolipoamide acetyltransferase family protein [Myxococcales bacterium]MDP3213889.1 dihydrolipoamide acetyltransferase family protein [Deltaproteobacteria bacterium]
MAKIIELPKLSPTMEEGTLVRWSRKEGDAVGVDDLLAEVETDKATMEFRSFDKGTLLKMLVPEGAVLKLGQPVAILGAPGEDISALLASVGADAPAKEQSAPAKEEAPEEEEAPARTTRAPASGGDPESAVANSEQPTRPPSTKPDGAPSDAAVRGERGVAGAILAPSSPRVRRIARERAVDLDAVPGSGERGRVTEGDLARPSAPKALVLREGDVARPASSMRKVIARRLVESKQTVPHFYLEADLDVEALLGLREQVNQGAAPEAKVSVNDLLLRACALALRAVPEANASWIDGQIVQYDRVDVSVAVSIDEGLLTPVLRGADKLSLAAVAKATKELVAKARARKLTPEEMTGGTFSLSNLGMFQIDRFAAVINPPESMILAVGAARDVPVVKAGAVVPGKRCAVTLSCDHRVVDGALGAKWLLALRGLVESPVRILV